MKKETKRVVYDGINIGVKALTLFIAVGLLMLGMLMAYGYLQGNMSEQSIGDADETTELRITVFSQKGLQNSAKKADLTVDTDCYKKQL